MKLIPIYGLPKGTICGYAKVDDADYDALSRHRWNQQTRNSRYHGYPVSKINGRLRKMHAMILPPKPAPGLLPDHRDRDPLNNQRNNLRWVDSRGNAANASRSNNRHGWRGLTWAGRRGWKVTVHVYGQKIAVQRAHWSEVEAAYAYRLLFQLANPDCPMIPNATAEQYLSRTQREDIRNIVLRASVRAKIQAALQHS